MSKNKKYQLQKRPLTLIHYGLWIYQGLCLIEITNLSGFSNGDATLIRKGYSTLYCALDCFSDCFGLVSQFTPNCAWIGPGSHLSTILLKRSWIMANAGLWLIFYFIFFDTQTLTQLINGDNYAFNLSFL